MDIEHSPPASIIELWSRRVQGAVLMCGLPCSRAAPQPELVVAPVPSPRRDGHEPRYCREFVVRTDRSFRRLEDTFGSRAAFTTPRAQSGFAAAILNRMAAGGGQPAGRSRACVAGARLGSAAVRSGREFMMYSPHRAIAIRATRHDT